MWGEEREENSRRSLLGTPNELIDNPSFETAEPAQQGTWQGWTMGPVAIWNTPLTVEQMEIVHGEAPSYAATYDAWIETQ